MLSFLSQPWPWYVAGPLIGLMVPLLLFAGNKSLGVSSSFRHICAAVLPKISDFFKYDWKDFSWNLLFVAGIVLGGFIGAVFLQNPHPIAISAGTKSLLGGWGIADFSGYIPAQLFGWNHLGLKSLYLLVVGGFLVGFGTRYAGSCTSGHTIFGLSTLSWISLIATVCFFIGGLAASWVFLPLLLGAS